MDKFRLALFATVTLCGSLVMAQSAPTSSNVPPATVSQQQNQQQAATTQTAANPTPAQPAANPAQDPPDPPMAVPNADNEKRLAPAPQPQRNIAEPPPPANTDQLADLIAAHELTFLQNLRKYNPIVETYVQNMKPDRELGSIPAGDQYFLGRLEFQPGRPTDSSLLQTAGHFKSMWQRLTSLFNMRFVPLGFAQMVVPDNGGLDRQHYDFEVIRREFLGNVRCIVLDVKPKPHQNSGRFIGRIWVEDHDYNIVRFNGTYSGSSSFHTYLHFDSWRLNIAPGEWLPAFVYSEETDLKPNMMIRTVRFKAQTRLWGYGIRNIMKQSEMTAMNVEGANVKDQSDSGQDLLPVAAERQWENQAEQNVLDRLTRAALLAAPGDVDKILETVVNNLEVTNNLDITPPVHCRVLLTSPIESFTVGHTIVLSRGLIDVLPDEATLAAFLAHELAHIELGHRLDTTYAFADRMMFPDEVTYRKLHFHRDNSDERAADEKALQFMQNSPYKDKLPAVGLFLKSMEQRGAELHSLMAAHLGNSPMADNYRRMKTLEAGAPELKIRDVKQLPALPLGSRVHVNPYTDKLELNKGKDVAPENPREKLSFEVTPVFPYLTRYEDANQPSSVAQAPAGDGHR